MDERPVPERPDGWIIHLDASDGDALAALNTDRRWSGYAIADLDPSFRAYSQVAVAWHPSGASAACTLYRHPAFTALIPHGDRAGLVALLAALVLPDRTFLHVLPQHRALLEQYFSAPEGLDEMLRMALSPGEFRPLSQPHTGVDRLATDDLAALEDLYAGYAASAFTADQLRTGIFYGVWSDGRLLAAGGTHVFSSLYGIAAVGNVFTRPEARGRGYAPAVTSAVVADLLAAGCRDIILNVAVDNATAIAIYERLGFRTHCRYFEGIVERR